MSESKPGDDRRFLLITFVGTLAGNLGLVVTGGVAVALIHLARKLGQHHPAAGVLYLVVPLLAVTLALLVAQLRMKRKGKSLDAMIGMILLVFAILHKKGQRDLAYWVLFMVGVCIWLFIVLVVLDVLVLVGLAAGVK